MWGVWVEEGLFGMGGEMGGEGEGAGGEGEGEDEDEEGAGEVREVHGWVGV